MENNQLKHTMKKLQRKLNKEIGFYWWKQYIASALWSNLSTPINLIITIFTALIAAEVTTNNMLSKKVYYRLSIVNLVLSSINTFFRPHIQTLENLKMLTKWMEFGNEFERIYFTECNNTEDYKRRLGLYENLQNDVNHFQNSHGPEHQNFISDFILLIIRSIYLKRNDRWLEIEDAPEMINVQIQVENIHNNELFSNTTHTESGTDSV
jgi:hypothetical protein